MNPHNTTFAGTASADGNFAATIVSMALSPLYGGGVLAIVAYFTLLFFSASVSSDEPPVIKPTIPWIGHIISLVREQTALHMRLGKRNLPIATLPMLNGKLYLIWEPSLVQSALRNMDMNMDVFVGRFARKQSNCDARTAEIVSRPESIAEVFGVIHAATRSSEILKMNVNAMTYVADTMEKMKAQQEIQIPNIWLWLRELMSYTTFHAVYGSHNPFNSDNPQLVDDVWTFEKDLVPLLFYPLPQITVRKGYQARENIQQVLTKFYKARHDEAEDASSLLSSRAAMCRRWGLRDEDVGKLEIALAHFVTANTIPIAFWFFAEIITRPMLVKRLREETLQVVKFDSHQATVNIETLPETCPLLQSCFREAIRKHAKSVINRNVVRDTVVTDACNRQYTLKKGTDVQLPSEALHKSIECWGPTADDFDAERFLPSKNSADEKKKRNHVLAFGGGRYLCPGRNFAQAENLGFVLSFILTYEWQPFGSLKLPREAPPELIATTPRPLIEGDGFGMKIKRRPGWEDVKWRFILSSDE